MDRKMEQVSSNLTNISGAFLFRFNFLVLNVETATNFYPCMDSHLTDFGFQDYLSLIQKKLLSQAQYWQQTHLCQPSCLCLT